MRVNEEKFWGEDEPVSQEDKNPSGAIRGAGARSPLVWKTLLVLMALTWGFSFFVMKDVLNQVPTFTLLATRFLPAAFIMFMLFRERIYKHFNASNLEVGISMGVIMWLAYSLQTLGLVETTPGKNAFLTGTYCILVPFISYLINREPLTRFNIGAAICCLCGIGLVALDSMTINIGDVLTLAGAFFFALQMSMVSKYGQNLDVNVITFWMFLVVGVLCLVTALLTEDIFGVIPWTPKLIGTLAFLSVVCTCVGLLIQNLALAHVPPATGSLLLSLESPSGVFFSVMLAQEVLTGRLLLGFALIFFSIVLSETHLSFLLPKSHDVHAGRNIVYTDGVETEDSVITHS